MPEATDDQPDRSEPFLRIVRGDASPAEIAALVAVLARRPTAPGAEGATSARSRSVWADRKRLMREPVSPSPGGWARSALPR